MSPRRGEYGFDAPYVPSLMVLGSAPLWAGAVGALSRGDALGTLTMGVSGASLLFCAATFVYATRRGKFEVWDVLLDALSLRGDERVLDVGCGRGAVLLAVARRLPEGRAVGVDIWRAQDQSGNAMAATERNAALEGVRERVELRTGDMRALPFDDASFDVVVSSLALHNLADPADRAKAVREVARVLKPGGRALLADFRHAGDYADTLRAAGLAEVQTRGLGVRFWYGGPWAATSLVTASRPGETC